MSLGEPCESDVAVRRAACPWANRAAIITHLRSKCLQCLGLRRGQGGALGGLSVTHKDLGVACCLALRLLECVCHELFLQLRQLKYTAG